MSSQTQKNVSLSLCVCGGGEGGRGGRMVSSDNSSELCWHTECQCWICWCEGEGANREADPGFCLPQVQRLIITVLMRSRCSWVKEEGGWRNEVWPVQGKPTRRSYPGNPKSPSRATDAPVLHVLISTQQVLLANTEICLLRWFSEPLSTSAKLKGYWDITMVINDLKLWGTILLELGIWLKAG